ncbi:DUF1002 domain-containing protein [Bacillus sp. 2205SS5-2]|uniref:DUF1002 domain-containing protein n=1 Tax=Bacillus sp. 2205SS5-2 TaxID=3109031 RepID=UPI003007B86C
MSNRIMKIIIALLVISFSVQSITQAADNKTSINEKFGLPIVVYGGSLSEAQKVDVENLLEVTDRNLVEEVTVTGDDLVKYIEGENRNARMFSSAKITRQEKDEGLIVKLVTPKNITQVTESMYANALITAGVEGAIVEVASPIAVSGHSALTGIYKAYDVSGEALNKERMEVANEELNIATEIAENAGIDPEKVSELLTEIKKEISEQNPVSRQEVEKIVEEKLKSLNINLSEQDRQLLIDLFDKIRSLNINFDTVKQQLNDLQDTISTKLDEIVGNEGFWQKVKNFFQSIVDFFKGLFN